MGSDWCNVPECDRSQWQTARTSERRDGRSSVDQRSLLALLKYHVKSQLLLAKARKQDSQVRSSLKLFQGLPKALWAIVTVIVTFLGVYPILIPSLMVSVSDPPDVNNPYSSSITVTNSGYVSLDSVLLGWSPGNIDFWGRDGQPAHLESDESKGDLHWEAWIPHRLERAQSFTESMNDVIRGNSAHLIGAQIEIVVDYEYPLLHIAGQKRFAFRAHRASNGNFYWYADTPSAEAK